MEKCYILSEFGGQWEDKWDRVINVYHNRHDAEIAAEKIEKLHKNCQIDSETWDKLTDEAYDYWDAHEDCEDSLIKVIHKIYPNYSMEELTHAEACYDERDWIGTSIEEHDLV